MVKNQNPPGNAAAIFWRCQDNAQFNIHINHTFIGAAKSPKPNQKFKTLIEKETKKNLGNFGDKAIKSISAHRGLQMGLLFFDLYHTLLNLARLITCFHYYTYILTVHIWENFVEEEAHTHGDFNDDCDKNWGDMLFPLCISDWIQPPNSSDNFSQTWTTLSFTLTKSVSSNFQK